MKAITGMFYTTALVAGLIGMRLAHNGSHLEEERERQAHPAGSYMASMIACFFVLYSAGVI